MEINRKAALAVGTVAVVLVAGATVAQAAVTDNMYPTANYSPTCRDGDMGDTFCQTDNKTLTIYRQGSLSSAEKTTVKRALTDYYSPTDLSVKFSSSGTYTGSSETDVVYQSKKLAATKIGITWCNDAVSSRKCDQHYIAFNSNHSSIGAINKSDACHETGHAVGLTHGPNASPALDIRDDRLGCMSYNDVYRLGANNRDNVNATY